MVHSETLPQKRDFYPGISLGAGSLEAALGKPAATTRA
jgi:hypothetical protein